MSSPEPDSVARNVRSWTEANAKHTDGRAAQCVGARRRRLGALAHPGGRGGRARRRRRASTWSSSAAARRTSRRGSPSSARVPSASTRRRPSSRRRGGCRRRRASSSRSSRRPASACRCRMRRSISPSRSTAPRSGPIRTSGCPRRRASCAPAAGSSSSATRRSCILCAPDTGQADEHLHRPQFGMYRFEWPDEVGVEFHLAHGDWIRLLRANGFTIEDLIELQAPAERGAARLLRLRHARVGAAVAGRGDLGSPQAMSVPPLLLASTSPQRRAILQQLGIPFDVGGAALRGERPAGGRRGAARLRPRARQGPLGLGGGGRPAGARRRHDGRPRRADLREACGRRGRRADARGAVRAARTPSCPACACGRRSGRSSKPRRRS